MAIAERIGVARTETSAAVAQRQAERQAELDAAKIELAATERDITARQSAIDGIKNSADVANVDPAAELKPHMKSFAQAKERAETLRGRISELAGRIPVFETRVQELRQQERLEHQLEVVRRRARGSLCGDIKPVSLQPAGSARDKVGVADAVRGGDEVEHRPIAQVVTAATEHAAGHLGLARGAGVGPQADVRGVKFGRVCWGLCVPCGGHQDRDHDARECSPHTAGLRNIVKYLRGLRFPRG